MNVNAKPSSTFKLEAVHPDPSQAYKMPYAPAIKIVGACDLMFLSGATASPLYHNHPHQDHEHVHPHAWRHRARFSGRRGLQTAQAVAHRRAGQGVGEASERGGRGICNQTREAGRTVRLRGEGRPRELRPGSGSRAGRRTSRRRSDPGPGRRAGRSAPKDRPGSCARACGRGR